jgi:hypothetical protein
MDMNVTFTSDAMVRPSHATRRMRRLGALYGGLGMIGIMLHALIHAG